MYIYFCFCCALQFALFNYYSNIQHTNHGITANKPAYKTQTKKGNTNMQKQTTTKATTTKAATTTKGGVITMPKPKAVVNSTVPIKAAAAAAKGKHVVKGKLTAGKAPVKVAAPIAAPLGVLTLAQTVVKCKGKANKAVCALFVAHYANKTVLSNKGRVAALYAAFLAYNKKTNVFAVANSNTCMPAAFYTANNIGNNSAFVNDAKKQQHYCCSTFNKIYVAAPTGNNKTALSTCLLNMAVCLPTLQAWHAALKLSGNFNQKTFINFVTKLIA